MYERKLSQNYNLRPCTRRARLGGRTALGRKRSYQNGWLAEEIKLKHNVVWENVLFVHILTCCVRSSTNDRMLQFSVLNTQLIGDALRWNWRSKSRKFEDILIEHARMERAMSYYEKRAPKNLLRQRPRLISHWSCVFGEKGSEKKIA